MKIESQFNDYYDHIQASHIDPKVLYHRQPTVKYISNRHPFIQLMNDNLKPPAQGFYPVSEKSGYAFMRFNPFVLGFCGQLIRGFQFSEIEYDDTAHSRYFYEAQSAFEYLKSQKQYVIDRRFFAEIEALPSESEMKLATSEDFTGNPQEITANFFQEMWCPIFLYNLNMSRHHDEKQSHVTLNPNLKKIWFNLWKDAEACYEEIFQFLANGYLRGTS